jgi:hypothetical protein
VNETAVRTLPKLLHPRIHPQGVEGTAKWKEQSTDVNYEINPSTGSWRQGLAITNYPNPAIAQPGSRPMPELRGVSSMTPPFPFLDNPLRWLTTKIFFFFFFFFFCNGVVGGRCTGSREGERELVG